MKNILLVYQKEAMRNQLTRYLEAGLGGEVTIEAVKDARIDDLRNRKLNACLIEENGMGAGVQLARDILSAAACKEGSDGQKKKPLIALLSEAPIRVFDNLRPQELREADFQVIGLDDLALFGFYLGRVFRDGSDHSPIKFDHWLTQEGLSDLHLGLFASDQRRRNEYLTRLCMGTDNGFLSRSLFEIIKPMLGSGCHKER